MAGVAADRGSARPEQVLQRLRQMLDDYQRQRRRRSPGRALAVPTGLEPLDRSLPHGGLPNAAVTEILFSAVGLGATSLALSTASRAIGHDRTVVVVDTTDDFYPPSVIGVGVPLERLLVIRAQRAADALWAVDQCLRCPAVGAVVARLEKVRAAESRRLQLAAEEGGGLGLVLKPLEGRERTFAAVQLLIEPVSADERAAVIGPKGFPTRQSVSLRSACRVVVLKVREGRPAGPFIVGLDDEAGFVPVHSPVVDRTHRKRRRQVGA